MYTDFTQTRIVVYSEIFLLYKMSMQWFLWNAKKIVWSMDWGVCDPKSLCSFAIRLCYFVVINETNNFVGFLKLFSLLSLSLSSSSPPLTTSVLYEAVTLWKLGVRSQDTECRRSSFCHTWLCTIPQAKIVMTETFRKSPDRCDMQKKQYWRNKGIKSRRHMPWGPFHRRLKGKSVVLQRHLLRTQFKFELRKFLLIVEKCTDLHFPVFELQVTCHL